jgi:hypothetical protein
MILLVANDHEIIKLSTRSSFDSDTIPLQALKNMQGVRFIQSRQYEILVFIHSNFNLREFGKTWLNNCQLIVEKNEYNQQVKNLINS